jgi:DNA-binding LytR/AlgR family response regulator
MLKLLVIDDAGCKKDLEAFISKHKKSVVHSVATKTLLDGLNELLGIIEANKSIKKLAVSTTENLTLLNIQDIIRCESKRNYTFIYTADGKKLIASKTLMDYETILQNYGFLRVHKSHLMNINYMDKYIKSEGGYMLLIDGTKLPVSVRKKEYLFKELEKLLVSTVS